MVCIQRECLYFLAYWLVLVTMTTVGYGDVYPTSLGGYIIVTVIMILGLTLTALPIAIVGGNFTVVYEYSQKVNKRNKETKPLGWRGSTAVAPTPIKEETQLTESKIDKAPC